MDAHDTYQQARVSSWTRTDMLIALYDGAIDRLKKARDALEREDATTAARLLLRVQRIVSELINGLDPRYGQLPRDLHRLYAYVLESVGRGTRTDLEGAIRVLEILREGWEEIAPEARRLEREGEIPPAGTVSMVQLKA